MSEQADSELTIVQEAISRGESGFVSVNPTSAFATRTSVVDPGHLGTPAPVEVVVIEIVPKKNSDDSYATAIATLGSPAYLLRGSLPVTLYVTSDLVTAHAPDLETWASGETEYEALDALRLSIADEYEFLAEEEGNLGPALDRLLRRFREVIQEVNEPEA